ncbi:hypothetical protein BKH43_08270 [Helicobacter sp. 13S00401-1]|uniref:replication initiation protein n=1 Tax=Helicobacter sp. 13S00401-1 TaxID=1905758 RepID=UPI000BA4F584|nr:replication initiation protein [Helicobacter sp. 13S00401-1]PAF47026.1 hypothetical protein BKH43_08270 [Helicobacter sp. 13S00401-1]
MNEVVKYHNDLNNIVLNGLSENQINILFTIFAKIKNKNSNLLSFSVSEIIELSGIEKRRKKYVERTIFAQFDKLQNLKIQYQDDYSISKAVIFPVVSLNHKENIIEVKVDEKFVYLFNSLVGNFTRFELAEFVSLSGAYAKTIYRFLKQWRSKGEWRINYFDFKRILGIPDSYASTDIDKQILKPAIAELSSEKNLFDEKRIPFKNLKVEKLDADGEPVKKGRKIVFLKFTFKSIKALKDVQEPTKESITNPTPTQALDDKTEINVKEYLGRNIYIPKSQSTFKIIQIDAFGEGFSIIMKNIDTNRLGNMILKTKKEFLDQMAKLI